MKLPAFPPRLARVVSALPAYPFSLGFAVGGRLLAWPALRELDWTPVMGRRLALHVRDLGLKVHFTVRPDGFRAARPGPAEATFTGDAADLARLALRLEDPDTLFFNRRLLIEGDTDLGLTVKNLLDGVDLEAALAAMPLGLGSVFARLRRELAA